MQIKESAENYLEAILMLKQKNGYVRSIDVAREMQFTKASISIAMKSFREEGYVIVDDDGFISLTEKGLSIAQKIYERHNVIAAALIALGVDEETAYHDSCKLEHAISDTSFDKLKEYLIKHDVWK